MNRRVLGSLLVPAAMVVASCVKAPSDPTIPSAMCAPRCERDHACDSTVDVAACVTRCEHLLGPRAIYMREDWVGAVRACAERQACVQETDQAISACIADARRRLQPTPAALRYCEKAQEKAPICRVRQVELRDFAHCVASNDLLSDPILKMLADCEDEPCRTHPACFYDVIGDDPILWRDDVQRLRNNGTLPGPAAETVALAAKIISEAKSPIPGATVCLRDSQVPCVTSDASGAFTLDVPAHQEIAITVSADGFAARLLTASTVGKGLTWTITLPAGDSQAARYTKLGTTRPDAASGAIVANTRAPNGIDHGLDGVTMSVDPPSGHGPFYFAPDGAPDASRTSTSTYAEIIVAGLAPGVVEVTTGPADVTCVPSFGGWPSNRPGSVRVPIVAGFETRLVMQCHK